MTPFSRGLGRLAMTALFVTSALGPVHAQPRAPTGVARKACPAWSAKMTFDCYHDYAEQTQIVRAMAAAYPQFASLESAGKSYQGRDIWVLTITDRSTGAPEDKPGVWIEGGVDSDEVTAVESALATAQRLLTSNDPQTLELRRTRTFYIAPNVIPDTGELWHHTTLRPDDSTQRPYDEDSDGLTDEDPPEDLDGDGQITLMRWIDPSGSLVADERDSRLMRTRRAGDKGPFYKTAFEGVDSDHDGKINEDWPGGVDPNRNYPNGWDGRNQKGAGPYAGSEPEIHALLEYNVTHPNIATSLHFHTAAGVILYPWGIPGQVPPAADLGLFKDVARRGLEVTGYDLATTVIDWRWPAGTEDRKATQVWRDKSGKLQSGVWSGEGGNAFAPEPAPLYVPGSYPAYGGSMDTTYPMFGILAYAMELYEMAPDLNGDGVIDDADRLMQNDKALGGVAFKRWTAFQHPTLGKVEIGGWTKTGWNNPLPDKLDAETRKGVNFAYVLGEATPLLSVSDVKVTPSEGVYRITAKVSNLGQMPTELAIRKGQVGALPVEARLELPAGASLISSKVRQDLGVIEGFGSRQVEWVVRAQPGAEVTVVAFHPKGGKARRAAKL